MVSVDVVYYPGLLFWRNIDILSFIIGGMSLFSTNNTGNMILLLK